MLQWFMERFSLK